MSKRKAKPRVYGLEVAKDLIEGMRELVADLEAGKPVDVRRVVLTMPIADLSPADIRVVRDSLGLSQPLFAEFIGASTSAIRAWERGAKVPTPMARRFLDAIRNDPTYWKKQLAKSIAAS
jgi:putative transcriptional regulator